MNAHRDSGDSVITMAAGTSLNVGAGTLTVTLRNSTDKTYNSRSVATLQNATAAAIVLNDGTVLANGTVTGPVTVNNGAVLGGTGTVDGMVQVNSGGRLAPGASAGTLTVNNNVTFTGGGSPSAFDVELNGDASHDQLRIAGSGRTLALGNANLNVAVGGGYSPAVGTQFKIIDVAAGSTLTGTFAGLPDNSRFYAGSTILRINYHAGTDGNDVVLTVDEAKVLVYVSPETAAEDSPGNLIYTFVRTGMTTSPLTVSFAVGGAATFVSDYAAIGAATFNATGGTVVIPAGVNTATVTIDPSSDRRAEGNEDVTLTVTSGTGYGPGTPASAAGTLIDNDHAPVITSNGGEGTASVSIAENATAVTTVAANDADGDTPTYILAGGEDSDKFTIDGTTGVLEFVTAPDFANPTDSDGNNTYVVQVGATDGPNEDLQTITVTVSDTNESPVLSAIGNRSVNEQATLNFTASATDQDRPAQGLTYTLNQSALDLGMTIDAVSGAFSWTPTENQGGASYQATITVTDDGVNPAALSASETITITVHEVNVAPVSSAIGNKTVNELATLTFTASATDADLPANTLTYSLVGAPSGAAINSTTGVFSWTPTESQGPGSYTLTVKVTDNGSPSLSDDEQITVTVNEVNVAPVLSVIGNKTVNELATLTFTASATDADQPANTLTYSLIGAPSGAAINSTTGVFSWTPTESQGPGSHTLTVKVTDNGSPSLSDDEQITITVNEVNEVPTLAPIADITISEDAGTQTILLTGISAGGSENQPIRVTSSSNSTGLFANPTVTYTSPNNSGSLAFQAAADQNGSAVVTVTVEDGGLDNNLNTSDDNATLNRQFIVTVTAVNDPPVRLAGTPFPLTIEENSTATAIPLELNNAAYGPGGGADEASQVMTCTLTAIPAYMQLFKANGTTAVLANSALACSEMAGLKYKTVAGARGTDTLAWKAADNGSPAQSLTESLAVTAVAFNNPPVRLAGKIKPIIVKEDKANTKAVSLKLSKLAYGPGGATSEAGQTLTHRVTYIPAGIQVFKKDGKTQVFTGGLVSLTDLKGLKYKTLPNATGTGVLTWTITDNGPIAKTLTESLTLTITAVNDAPVRTAGTLTPLNVLKDSANTTAVSLKLGNLAYGPGGGADESSQPLKYVVTAIPAYIQLFKSSGAAVTVNASLTITDLQGLAFKTVAGRTGSGSLTWTVSDNGSPTMAMTEKLPITVGSALRPATAASQSNANDIVTSAELQPLVDAAISRWAAAGLDPAKVAMLARVQVTIADLSSQGCLGFASQQQIVIDDNGAGLGWFIDATPNADEEFAPGSSGPAASQLDLLTVVMHELGHVLGLNDLDAQNQADQLMAGTLDARQRRTPDASTSASSGSVDCSFLLGRSRSGDAAARSQRNVQHELDTDRVFADF